MSLHIKRRKERENVVPNHVNELCRRMILEWSFEEHFRFETRLPGFESNREAVMMLNHQER